MKKALPNPNEVFISEVQGKPHVWDFFAEEIVEFANNGLKNEPTVKLVYQKLREWMSRYLKEGITDDFLNDLNAALHEIRYSKYILPLDLLPSETGFPQNAYVAKYDKIPEPEAYAADDFSKLLTSGKLKRLKRCQMEGCANFFWVLHKLGGVQKLVDQNFEYVRNVSEIHRDYLTLFGYAHLWPR